MSSLQDMGENFASARL